MEWGVDVFNNHLIGGLTKKQSVMGKDFSGYIGPVVEIGGKRFGYSKGIESILRLNPHIPLLLLPEGDINDTVSKIRRMLFIDGKHLLSAHQEFIGEVEGHLVSEVIGEDYFASEDKIDPFPKSVTYEWI